MEGSVTISPKQSALVFMSVYLLSQIASCFTDCSSSRQYMQVVFFITFASMLFVD